MLTRSALKSKRYSCQEQASATSGTQTNITTSLYIAGTLSTVINFSGSASAWAIRRRSKGSLWWSASCETPAAWVALTGSSRNPLVLDTRIFLWACAASPLLKAPVRRLIQFADEGLCVGGLLR